jgi:hypothetical protein
MGGKTSKSTQTVSIPPEVLARYNAVNARAEEAAGRPFQPYSYNPADFVAQLTPTQLAGIQNVNYAAGQAQPYFDEATGQLMGAQMAAVPYYAQAEQDIGYGQMSGQMYQQQAAQQLAMAQAAANPLNYRAGTAFEQAYAQGQPFIGGAVGQFAQGQEQAAPYQQAAGMNIAGAQDIGAQLAQQAYGTQAGAGAAAIPINLRAYADLAAAYGSAQPLNQAAVAQYYAGLAGAQPLQQLALQNLGRAGGVGETLSGSALQNLASAAYRAEPLQQMAQGIYGQAFQAAQPYSQAALQQYYGGLGAAAPISQAALANLAAGQQAGQDITSMALSQLGIGQAQVTPIQQAALQAVGAAPYAAAPLTQAATANIAGAQAMAAPYQQLAGELGLAAARPVTPEALTGAQVQQYISPYLSNVVSQTQALLNQQAQQAQSQQLGNAIRSGAFGGDRAGIAAANLAQQQQLAQGKVISDLLQSGYGQALQTAQQQQQLGLGAEQANRAAQQAAAGQLLGVGQAGFGQGIGAAQQQAALAQQLYGQQVGAGQAQAALAQQLFGQSATAAQQQQAAAQSLFGQSATAAQQQAALAQQLFGQQAAAGQNIAGLGQQVFGQGLSAGQAQAALAQQLFGQGATTAQQQAAIAQALFGQGATTAQQQAALAQQGFGQNVAVGQNIAQLAQQLYGQGLGTAQAQAAIGQQGFAQQMQQAQQQQALSQLLFGQGTTAAQQQAALGQQLFGQGITGGQALLGAGQQAYQQGMGLGAAQQGLAQQVFGQGLSASQQQAALGQQGFAQQLAAAQARQGLGQGLYGMGASTAQQLAALGTGAQGAALTGAQAQLAAGQAQQQTAQAGLQALYNQFLQQQAYPFQAAQFLANVAMGTGALSGSTQTAVTPGGLLSDVRMKENIREVGKTFDGQPVYSYNYKGDDKTQMGMLAQEVEQKHPEAVGLAGGMKTVDYDKATRNSARKPVTIDGEYTSSEGGPVLPHRAGEGFARGGYANGGSPGLAAPGDMAALLAAQAQMFGPFSGAGMPTGGMPGMPGYVPNAGLPVSELVTPGPMPEAPDAVGQMQKIADIGKTGQEIYQKYKDKQTEKSATDAINRRQPTPVITSSTRAAADGGAIMPYSQGQNQALNIPTEKMEVKKLETPAMPQGRSAVDDVAAIAQTAAAVMAMFSDSRVKEDIKHIGHTHDGQKIYSYRYKGEPQTHIGLLAQEVEKKHPDAVGNIKGIKTVNYDMATEDAANKAVALARGKAAGGRAGYQTAGTVKDDPSFIERMIPGVQTQEGVDANRRDIMRVVQERILDNPYLNPAAALRRREQAASSQPGLAAASQPAPTATAAPPAAAPPAAVTTQRRPSAVPAETPAAPPAVDNRNVFPSSQFANLPESPMDGLAAAAAPPPAPTGLAPTPAPSMPASLTGERDLGMAPMLGGTVKPAGLTPSKAEVVSKDRSAPVESRMTAFLEWVKQPENFIPLATGIAAATAAPTRDPFVALAQGFGAGAQAYQPVMQRKAEIDKIKAEADRVRAETGVFEASTLRELQQIANIRGLVPKEDPNGVYRVGDKRYSLVPVTQAIQKSGTGEVLPTGAAGAPTTGVLGKNALEAAQEAGTKFFLLPETTQETSRQQIDQSLAAGNKARNDLIDINRFAQSAALPRTPILEQGALFPIKNQLASFYDSLVTTFVKDPALQAQLRIDPASMTQAQISEKVAFGTAALREAGAGQRSLGALEAFLAGSPNQTQTRDTMVNLIADMIIHNQKLTDEAAAISEYDRIVETNSGFPRNFLYTDAVRAYQQDKPITAYERDRDQLVSIMMKDAYPEFVRAMKDPKLGPEMIQLLDNKYGKGFHRYFTGSVMQ